MAANKRRILALILGAAAAAAAALAYVRYGDTIAEAPGGLILYGNVDIRQVDLAFNVEGRIDSMLVEEGDAVAAGQLVARLDASRYGDALAAARAKAASQQAIVARLEAGSRPEEIAKAEADVRAAEATWRTAQATLKRKEQLALDRFTSQQALDDARAAENEAKGRLEALRQILALAVAGPRQEDIAEVKAMLASAQAEMMLAQHRLADTELRAPADGIVLTRVHEPGAVILSNTPVYTIALASPVWVRTYVSEPDLGRIQPGMKAEITTDTAPGHAYEGWVGFVSPTAEFTPKSVQTTEIRTSLVYRLRVYARNPDGGLRQGMPVTVRLLVEGADGAAQGAEKNAKN